MYTVMEQLNLNSGYWLGLLCMRKLVSKRDIPVSVTKILN